MKLTAGVKIHTLHVLMKRENVSRYTISQILQQDLINYQLPNITKILLKKEKRIGGSISIGVNCYFCIEMNSFALLCGRHSKPNFGYFSSL